MNFEQIKQNLLNQQQQLKKRIDAIKLDFSNQRSADFAEQATEQENEEVLTQLLYEAEKELNQVNTALNKISSGEYGVCEQCGQSIQLARLIAVPYTPFCIKCT